MDSTFVALMSLAGTAIGSIGGILASARLTNHRLQQLEEKVKIHNSLVERMCVVEERSKGNSHRLDNIEI